MSITPKELMEDGVKRRIEAYFPPKAPSLAIRLFNFFVKTQKYQIVAGGVEHYIIGLDLHKIGEVGKKYYNIDISKYINMFEFFEEKLLDKIDKERKQK